jgi:putative exporter of polyketide antibiotics
MKIAAWVVAILLLVAGIAIFFEALTTTHSVWLSLPLLMLSGLFTGPAMLVLLAMFGLYDLAIEVNGHRMVFRKRDID